MLCRHLNEGSWIFAPVSVVVITNTRVSRNLTFGDLVITGSFLLDWGVKKIQQLEEHLIFSFFPLMRSRRIRLDFDCCNNFSTFRDKFLLVIAEYSINWQSDKWLKMLMNMMAAVAYIAPYLYNFKKCKVKDNKPFVTKYSRHVKLVSIMYH